jgi:putative effector of murein hydrolase LrgA (UPF0299 family)
MIKMLLAFLIVFFILYFGIPQYRELTGKNKWDLAKLILFSLLCTVISIGLLVLFVVLF